MSLHHNFVVTVLSDLFGIQARGGCSCAGPYGHRLLDIDAEHSQAFEPEISLGCEGIKPGWVRINFNYFLTDTVRDYLIDAVDLLARHGHRLLPYYRFDPAAGLWHHRAPSPAPDLCLTDVCFTPDGTTTPVSAPPTADEHILPEQLDTARRLLEALPDTPADALADLPAQVEALRWFPLPARCLDPIGAADDAQA
jgi:hypothetical protein